MARTSQISNLSAAGSGWRLTESEQSLQDLLLRFSVSGWSFNLRNFVLEFTILELESLLEVQSQKSTTACNGGSRCWGLDLARQSFECRVKPSVFQSRLSFRFRITLR